MSKSSDKINVRYVYGIALIASVGGFLFGFDLVIISGAILFIEDAFQLSTAMKGFVVSSAILGSVSGPLIGLKFADFIGRRKTMMIAALLFMLSAVGSAMAFGVWDLCFWRFIGGVGIGLAMMTSPIYIAELAPVEYRGRLVNVNQLSNVIGINIAVIVSYFFSFQDDWRMMLGFELIPILILLLGLFFIPESPRWLILKRKESEGLKVLQSINGRSKGSVEFEEIKSDRDNSGAFKVNLFQGKSLETLIVVTIFMIFSQINGVNMLLLYAPTILSDLNISIGSGAILSSLPIYLFIFLCTLIAFPLIKWLQRRTLLLISVSFMALSHLVMFGVINSQIDRIYTLIPMLMGTGAFTLGFAPLSWIISSELFPNHIRGKAMGIVCAFLYLSSFVIAQIFPSMNEYFQLTYGSTAGVYLVFMVVCVLCVLFSWKYIPETKNLRLEEIQ
ncbi:sugar porter family MFS transporter [Membranihabitans marinus]|uniref:sugar porter family MFS transporter n=1 Tax=Membranihabitans marinus TaxID=1227546 RepID=UPI001EFFA17E|nr:sugar porter family MFS transporter [Membranihabitans marinus]